jgi:ribonucleoside-diphosphate reductase alpha chain
MWEQKDCIDYLKTAAVLAAYVDQSISTNTFYNPANYIDSDAQKDRKVPGTLIANNLMLGTHWGLKSFYYSLLNKMGSKDTMEETPESNVIPFTPVIEEYDESDCESCKL